MVVVALTSFRKGGTGKSTLSSSTAMAPREDAQRAVCIIDCDGGSSQVFRVNGMPGLGEVLSGKAKLRDVVLEVEVEEAWPTSRGLLGGGKRPRLWVLPRGKGKITAEGVLQIAEKLNSFADVIIDLPAYSQGEFDAVVREADVILLIANPDEASIRVLLDYSLAEYRGVVKPVLNKSPRNRELTRAYFEALSRFGSVVEVGFDPALTPLFKSPEEALRKMSKVTARELETLAREAFTPVAGV